MSDDPQPGLDKVLLSTAAVYPSCSYVKYRIAVMPPRGAQKSLRIGGRDYVITRREWDDDLECWEWFLFTHSLEDVENPNKALASEGWANERPKAIPETPQGPGGQGELLTDPHRQRGDLAMVEQAVRQRWGIPEASFQTLPVKMVKMAHNVGKDGKEGTGKTSESAQIRATRVVAMMHGQNLSDDQSRNPQQHIHYTSEQIKAMSDEELKLAFDRLSK